jgi:hypothetical protein
VSSFALPSPSLLPPKESKLLLNDPLTESSTPNLALHAPPGPAIEYSPPNYGLSPTECRAQFSGLFDQIDRSVAWRKNVGNITRADLDLSWKPTRLARIMIHNQKVIPAHFHLHQTCRIMDEDSKLASFAYSSTYWKPNLMTKGIKDFDFLPRFPQLTGSLQGNGTTSMFLVEFALLSVFEVCTLIPLLSSTSGPTIRRLTIRDYTVNNSPRTVPHF